jgi:ankyrin repeat protein
VRLLLDKGADIESKDKYGRTALQFAAFKCHDAIGRIFVLKGASSAEDCYGLLALVSDEGEVT